MAVYNRLYDLAMRAKHRLSGADWPALADQLRREQYYSKDDLVGVQEERLRRLLTRAQGDSPYYGSLFKKLGLTIDRRFGLNDLPKIPLLQRKNVQESLEDIRCRNTVCFRNSSGGSTGNPVSFYQDAPYATWSEAQNELLLTWMGVHRADKTAILWGADQDLSNLSFRDQLYHRLHRNRQLNSFLMTDQTIDDFLAQIAAFRPRYVYGYASSLDLIARRINETGALAITPVAIRSSAEMLYDHQRSEIERAFGAKVYNTYGSREINNLAAECSAHDGLHVFASGRIVEIVDENGRPVPDGTVGLVAVTDLTNLSFPFVRYLIGDMAAYKATSTPCPCGRIYPRLDRIEGRSSDMIVVNGQYIHGEFFTHLFYNRTDVEQFQLIQEDEHHFRLLVVPRGPNPDLEDVLKAIRERAGARITLEVEFHDGIAPTASGKHRFTISRVSEQNKK